MKPVLRASLLSEHVMMYTCCPLLITGSILQYAHSINKTQVPFTVEPAAVLGGVEPRIGQMFIACCTASCALEVSAFRRS